MSLLTSRPARSRYDTVSEASAAVVIRGYSTSFGLASRLLAEPVRTQVRNIYALVRVADEVVDNPDPSLDLAVRAGMLARLQEDVRQGLETGCSSNLVVHAFVRTALDCGIGLSLVDPFFDSMRMDLATTSRPG
jgi:15-cis-phytoene synthase